MLISNENKQEIKERLLEYVEMVTASSKGGLFVCPLCSSGTGARGTGAFSVRGTGWKCFSCGESGDIFTLCGKVESLATYGEQVERLGEFFGLSLDSSKMTEGKAKQKAKVAEKKVSVNTKALDSATPSTHALEATMHATDPARTTFASQTPSQEALPSYHAFYTAAHARIHEIDYPTKRGLGPEIIARFKLGYEPNWRHPKAPHAPISPRLIIPTSDHSYLARDIREDIPEVQWPYSKSQVGSIELFNTAALRTAEKPIFVVEGAMDALSIMEVGGEAIALGTTAKVRAFLELMDRERPSQPLILAMDNDKAGQEATQALSAGLLSLGVPFSVSNIAGEVKDANEALQRHREVFTLAVQDAENKGDEAKETARREEAARKEAYIASSAGNSIEAFREWVMQNAERPHIATGFEALDCELDGGLYEGLYIIGAISSLGKTTLMTQMADQIAKQSIDVLIFSLEMAKTEIMSKSISRQTLERCLYQGLNTSNAKTARGITDGRRYDTYNNEEFYFIYEAADEYADYAKHIYISEGIGDIGVKQVREKILEHRDCTGKTPVVIIDYLQILAPYNDRATDKQNMDKAVLELKRVSRDFKTPVIGISSFNRASYKDAVTMEAFKESGAIEYSSDVLLGLQLKGAGEKDFDATEAKRREPREIELVVLKNRNGRVGGKVCFQYYPLFNYFKEVR